MKSILVIRSAAFDSWTDKISALTYAAAKRDARLHVIHRQVCAKEMKKLIKYWQPDGIIITELKTGIRPFPATTFNHVPTVFMDCAPEAVTAGCPLVLHDSAAICSQAVHEFLNMGCREVGYVGWYENTFWSDSKRIACRDVLSSVGKHLYDFIPSQQETDDINLLNRNLSNWIRDIPRPCGILATNDIIGEQIICIIQKLGLTIPTDVAVIGVDNNNTINERTQPALSSFALDFNRAAETVLSVLLNPEKKHPPEILFIPPRTFIRRQSSQILRRKDREVTVAMERIHLKACTGLKPADVLAGFSCSRRTAESKFKEAVGHSIGEEILSVKLNKALQLLDNPNIKISAIADICGFPSPLLLRRQFHARYGMTPGMWRKSRHKKPRTEK